MLSTIFWRFKVRKRVRVHLRSDMPTLEGIYAGRIDGHYLILKPDVYETSGRSHALDGAVEVPASNVAFFQVL